MRPRFDAHLVNDRFGDPALYVRLQHERRALLFDLGSIDPLSPRQLLRVTHVFVSHAHMDHFIGFDRLVRTCLHRNAALHLVGPARFVAQVEHRLAGYTWNVIHESPTEFTVVATEVADDTRTATARFSSRSGFRRHDEAPGTWRDGIVLDDETFVVRATVLDHRTPCLAFALQEKAHVAIRRPGLDTMALAPGPWLTDLKRTVVRGAPDDEPIRVWRRDDGAIRERDVPLGDLRGRLFHVTPGQKLAYVVDARASEDNRARIVALARGADVLFIEAPFADDDAALAMSRDHLTAGEAGRLARAAQVGAVVPFHFSPRYADRAADLERETHEAHDDR